MQKGNTKYHVQIETSTGRIFELRPLIYFMDGKAQAKIYPRYYKDTLLAQPLPHAELTAVSYTLLTRPTTDLVWIPVVAVSLKKKKKKE